MCGTGDVGAMPVKIHPTQKGRQCSGVSVHPGGFQALHTFQNLHFPIFHFVSLVYYCTMKM